MQLNVVQNGGNFQNYALNTAVVLGGDWQQYVIYFQGYRSGSPAGFYFGGQTGTTWLDGVVVQ